MKETKRSRTHAALVNVIFNVGYQLINMVVNLIIPPLIIGRFGSAINGLILTIKQVISYVQLVGAGIAESTVVTLYKPLADQDEEKISGIFNAGAKAFWRAGIIFSSMSVLLAFLYPFFIKEDLNKIFIGTMVLVLCIAGASEFFVIGKCRTLLTADQRVYIVNMAQIVGALGMLVATVIMIKIGANVLIVQLIASCAYILRLLILYFYVKRNYRFLDKKVPPCDSATSRRKAATVHQLASIIVFGSQTIVISNFVGLKEASVYSVYALVFTGVNTLLSTLSSALLASFGDIIASDDQEMLTKSFNLYEFFYYFLIFCIYSVTYIMMIPFVSVYMAGVTDANYIRPLTAALFCIMGILNCSRTPGSTLINAIGHYDETKNRALIEMTICLVGEIVLVNFWGINGVILGTMAAFVYRMIDIIVYSNHRILKRSALCTFRRMFVNACACAVLIGVAQLVPVHAGNYVSWAIYGLGFSIAAFAVFLTVNYIFYRQELMEFILRVKRIVIRK